MHEYENPWKYQGKDFLEVPEGIEAFVYKLTHEKSGKSYIGLKTTRSFKYRQVKGKKKKVRTESDWRNYYSSNTEIQELHKSGDFFIREILHLCPSKGVANYLEAREQMDNRVLENPDKWFNGMVNCRVSRNHIKPLIKNTP